MITITGRTRKPIRETGYNYKFVNPFPQMSETEAMVYVFLEGLGVPFSWRKFDAQELAPNLMMIDPGFTPEFTLKEFKSVILVVGSYWGNLPNVLDRNIVAQFLLEADGWHVAILFEADIRKDVAQAVFKQLPNLNGNTIRGVPRNSPTSYDYHYLDRRREFLRSLNFLRRGLFSKKKPFGQWSERRQPKRSDRRNIWRIERSEKPKDVTFTGQSRLAGKAPAEPGRPYTGNTFNEKFGWRK